MDFLNKSFAQLSELFQSMTVGARITSALLLATVLGSVGYLFNSGISSPDCDLMHGMPIPASQIPAMEAAFSKAKLTGYEIRGSQIFVPRGQAAAYQAALAEAKVLPRGYGDYLRKSMEDGGVFDDRTTKERRAKIALQDELANIISHMTGIESAYVIYDTDTKTGLSREKVATASVSVKPIGDTQLDEAKVSSIRHFVAGAIANMKTEDVTVADLNGRVYPGGSDGGGAEENAYVQLKRTYEEDLKRKIISALAFVPNVIVEPLVVLDRNLGTTSRQIQHDPKAVPYSTTETSSTKTREGGAPGGRPGYASQTPNAALTLPASAMSGSREDEENSKNETRSLVSGSATETHTIGLTPKLARVSIGLPSSYFVKIWHERNDVAGEAPKTPEKTALDAIRQEESTSIQKYVSALLPPPTDSTTEVTDLVTVTTFQDMKMPEIPTIPISRQVFEWLSRYWSTLGLIALAAFSLIILRSMVRSAPPALRTSEWTEEASFTGEAAAGRTRPQQVAATAGVQDDEPTRENPLRRSHSGNRSLRDDLSELVREDPNVAANILKTWIGHRG